MRCAYFKKLEYKSSLLKQFLYHASIKEKKPRTKENDTTAHKKANNLYIPTHLPLGYECCDGISLLKNEAFNYVIHRYMQDITYSNEEIIKNLQCFLFYDVTTKNNIADLTIIEQQIIANLNQIVDLSYKKYTSDL